jgi:1-acyl-sn-glycerol-3-phosphate acyltransferase
MWLEKKIFSLLGWNTDITIDLPDKCVACIAPHTSNWDFVYCVLFKQAYGITVNFFIKDEWTRLPVIGAFIRRLGGIGVKRDKSQSMTDVFAKEFDRYDTLRIAITPEGTRSPNSKWKLGFYYIALKAGVPIVLVSLDYRRKLVIIDRQIIPDGNAEKQLAEIKAHYKDVGAKYPEKFKI